MTVEKTILYIGRAIDREADMILKIVHYDNVIGVQDSVYDQVVDYFVTRGPYEKIKGKNDRVAVDGFIEVCTILYFKLVPTHLGGLLVQVISF